eukprot:Pgem_evm2s2434
MVDVLIIDDGAQEYGVDELLHWLNPVDIINRKKANGERYDGATMSSSIGYKWFLKEAHKKYDWIINFDSDLIVVPDWYARFQAAIPKSKGVLSLYNSGAPTHKSKKCEDGLCEKESMGNAGSAFSREFLTKLDASKNAVFSDWEWTAYATNNKIKQLALYPSAAVHVGMHGSWGASSQTEVAIDTKDIIKNNFDERMQQKIN